MNAHAGIIVAHDSTRALVEEIREILVDVAKSKQTITYSDLAHRVKSRRIKPNDQDLTNALDAISLEEESRGRGMLSAVVVSKRDGLPGYGFFHLGRRLGRQIPDRNIFWLWEFDAVCASYSE